jgi:hypothetical protein
MTSPSPALPDAVVEAYQRGYADAREAAAQLCAKINDRIGLSPLDLTYKIIAKLPLARLQSEIRALTAPRGATEGETNG